MIVYPAIDVRGGKVVRLTRGRLQEVVVYADDPVAVAERFAAAGAEWLHVVDLDAAFETGDNRAVIHRIVEAAGIPVQAGGGLRSLYTVETLVEMGVARVILGTEAVGDPEFLQECLERHGEKVVVALDTDGTQVLVRGWTEGAGAYEEVLEALEQAGAPRFLVTSVPVDGTLAGPDLDLYRRTVARTKVPVIASGGVASVDDLPSLADTGVEGIVIGKALYEGTLDLREARGVAR